MSGESAEIKNGNCLPLSNIPEGTLVHNIEMRPGKGAQIARSAGSGVQLMAKEGEYVTLKLRSGEVRLIHKNCRATIGVVGNSDHENVSIGKAGRMRWMGRRPRVRAVAMNPVDHPMGGGEGRSSGGRHPCSPWVQRFPLQTRQRRARGRGAVRPSRLAEVSAPLATPNTARRCWRRRRKDRR